MVHNIFQIEYTFLLAGPDRLLDRVEDQRGDHRRRNPPPQHPASVGVSHEGDVGEPGPGRDIGVGVGPGAPCQPCGWWVSPARPPNRTCPFLSIRLSVWFRPAVFGSEVIDMDGVVVPGCRQAGAFADFALNIIQSFREIVCGSQGGEVAGLIDEGHASV